MSNLLKERVAVVTGAGRGLGRAHALALANEGARVVVNDLGAALDGSGTSRESADSVVQEITKSGGTAIASYESVSTSEGCQNIIKSAQNNFGRLDILVNNAGFTKDRMVFNMTDEEWDQVLKVHLYGTFYCIRAASRVMREQKYGRIINTSSNAGLGNLGQANYSSAKEAIVGLTRTVARDLAQSGITCNAIRPGAGTRMTLTDKLYQATVRSIGEEKTKVWRQRAEAWRPEDISPLVVYLASENSSNVSGCIFEVRSNWIGIYGDPPRIEATLFKEDGRWLPEELVQVMPKTLTEGQSLPPPDYQVLLSPGAQGWQFAKGKLENKQAFILYLVD